MEKGIWYEINFEYKIRVLEDVKDISGDTLYLIKLNWNGRTHTTSFNNSYKLYEIDVLDKELRHTEICVGKFKIQNIYHSYSNFFQDNIEFRFVDCCGISKEITFYDGLTKNFEEAFNYLISRKHCNTFKEFELENQLNYLSNKISEFEDKFSEITQIINRSPEEL
jgi:hypothetical protein